MASQAVKKSFARKMFRQWSKSELLMCITLCVITTVASSIFRKKMYNAFGQKYVFFRQELTNFMYDVWASLILAYKVFYTREVTYEMLRFPFVTVLFIAFLDGCSDFLTSVGGVGTPGSYQVLLQQTVIIVVMWLSSVFLNKRFSSRQLLGGALTVIGSLLAITPSISSLNRQHAVWYSVVIFASSNFPSAMSSVWKERSVKGAALDVVFFTCYVSWVQLAVVWLLAPLLALPGFGGQSLADIPEVMSDGLRCFFGDTSMPVTAADGAITGYCSSHTTLVTFGFSLCGFAGGVLQLLILKHGSAVLASVVVAAHLPLANMAFSLSPLMGVDVEPFSSWDLFGLLVVMLGAWLYSMRSSEFSSAEDGKGSPVDDEVYGDEEDTLLHLDEEDGDGNNQQQEGKNYGSMGGVVI